MFNNPSSPPHPDAYTGAEEKQRKEEGGMQGMRRGG